MADRPLDRGDRDGGAALAERLAYRERLGEVAGRGRGGVGVDVVDLVRLDVGVGEGGRDRPGRADALGVRRDRVPQIFLNADVRVFDDADDAEAWLAGSESPVA